MPPTMAHRHRVPYPISNESEAAMISVHDGIEMDVQAGNPSSGPGKIQIN